MSFGCAKQIARILIAAAVLLVMTSGPDVAYAGNAGLSKPVPAQPLVDALEAFARNAGLQVVYGPEITDGIRSPGAAAGRSVEDTLRELLRGTGLTFEFVNEKTVTLLRHPRPRDVSSSVHPQPDGRDSRQLQNTLKLASADVATRRRNDEGEEEAAESATAAEKAGTQILVTGSRIRRDPQETDISPVTVFSRVDIERSGAVTMADFVGRITQASSDVSSREASSDPRLGRTTVNLRGLGNNTTLVLLNGRRLPKAGQGFGFDDYNLNGLPLASVERIEILTNTASAIYGSDAIGGVINIITRENYSGLDASLRYGNAFDSDVSEKAADLTAGHAGALGAGQRHYAVTLSLSTNEHNALAALDRPYTARTDYGDSGGRPPQGVSVFSTSGGAGSVSTVGLFNSTPLPGLAGNAAAIPTGQDGRNLAVADFVSSGPIVSADGDLPRFRQLLSPTIEQSASLSASLDLNPRMQLFATGSYSQYRVEFDGFPPSGTVTVPAQNPFNPFGIAVDVNKVFYEIGPARGVVETRNSRFDLGLRGDLFDGWRYEVYGDYSRFIGENTNPVPAGLSFQAGSPGAAALAQTDPALALNVFGDGRSSQTNDQELLRSILGVDDYRDTSETWAGAFQADGALLELPGGTLKMAVGGEYRKEEVSFYKLNTTSSFSPSLDDGAKRDVRAAFVELSVPLIGENQQLPGVESLLLSLAGRVDSESLFGEEFTPKAGLMWRPFRSLALRTTYSRGYKVPTLRQLMEPDFVGTAIFFSNPPVDPVTGEVLTRPIMQRRGGNLALDPEESVSWSAGFIYEPVWLPRLSLSADYFDIDYTNKVSANVGVQNILNFFPERVERDPVTNLLTLVDIRAINLSTAHAAGIDARLVYRLGTAAGGVIDTHWNYTYNLTSSTQTIPGATPFETVDQSFFPRVRANADLFWSRGGLELGSVVAYESSTRNVLVLGAVAPVRIRHAIVVDLQSSFDFSAAQSGAMQSRWLEGLKLTFGINNVFDRVPSPTDGIGGMAKVDPRQRRYYLSLRKTF